MLLVIELEMGLVRPFPGCAGTALGSLWRRGQTERGVACLRRVTALGFRRHRSADLELRMVCERGNRRYEVRAGMNLVVGRDPEILMAVGAVHIGHLAQGG